MEFISNLESLMRSINSYLMTFPFDVVWMSEKQALVKVILLVCSDCTF